MTKRVRAYIIWLGIILVLGGLAAYIPYVIFPMSLGIVLLGIFWARVSRTEFWRHACHSRLILLLFPNETSKECYSKPNENRSYRPVSKNEDTESTHDSNSQSDKDDILSHTTPPKESLK